MKRYPARGVAYLEECIARHADNGTVAPHILAEAAQYVDACRRVYGDPLPDEVELIYYRGDVEVSAEAETEAEALAALRERAEATHA